MKEIAKKLILLTLPFVVRKRLAIWLNSQEWIAPARRNWWSCELVKDLLEKDINMYHKFLWLNHMGYATPYEVASKFGVENMEISRKMFFSELKELLKERNISPEHDIKSVFEVGCSLGYQLRYMETELFTSATRLDGIDIDEYAIRSGSAYLRDLGSKVRLKCADMEDLANIMNGETYDIIVCSGVLMYLEEYAASRVVDIMLKHTNVILAFTGLAHSDIDNSQLKHSVPRGSDMSIIHNIDSMVKKAGGTVYARRWEGKKMVNGHTIYFVFSIKNP